MKGIKVALLDMNNNHANQGMRNIKEISQAFMLRSSDFSKNTKIAFILNSKNFYNLQSIDFRKYFLFFNIGSVIGI